MRNPVWRAVTTAAALGVMLAGYPAEAEAQWTIAMRAMQDPLPVGQCTAIEIVVQDGSGAPPIRPDGRQLDWQDFELEFTASVPDAFAWSNERHRFLCARTSIPASATVIARYPGAHLQPNERVPGIEVRHSIVVTNLVPPSQVAYQTPPQSPVPGQPTVPPPASPAPAEAQPAVKSVGGLFKKIGSHLKQKAGEVTTQTAQSVATGATQVVDTTLETGGGVVSSAALEATNTARTGIGSVGRSLTPVALRGGESADNLATVMAAGGGELRMLRFTGNTDVLEPGSRDLIERLAAALNATQGRFVIEAHVDPLASPAASQQLSEHRAAAVKLALVRSGVAETRLTALGYGASEPKPEVPPNGGPPSSARIVMVRETVAAH